MDTPTNASGGSEATPAADTDTSGEAGALAASTSAKPSSDAPAPAVASAPAPQRARKSAILDTPATPVPEPLHRGVVAQGRTVVAGGKSHGPGREIELPHREIARLRGSGALIDPDRPAVPRAGGAAFAKR